MTDSNSDDIWREVELDDPEVDADWHTTRAARMPATTARAASGRYVRLHKEMGTADHPRGAFWAAGRCESA